MRFLKNNNSRLWLLAALLVLALSVTLFAACDKTPDQPDTTDPSVSVGGPTQTDESGDPATREPGGETTSPVDPDGTDRPADSEETSEPATEVPTDPPVISVPGD